MNAISKLMGRPTTGSVAVPQDQMDSYYEQVLSFQASRARRARRGSQAAWFVAGALLVSNLMLGYGFLSVLPTVRLQPVFIYPRGDGTVISSVDMSSLPTGEQDAMVQASLWQYVQLREGYSIDTAQYNYHVVSALSSPQVRAQYQSWFNFPSRTSPQTVYGKVETVHVERMPGSGWQDDDHKRYLMMFRRVVEDSDGKAISSATWAATLYVARINTIPVHDRLTFNPAGVVVTGYPGAEQMGQPQ